MIHYTILFQRYSSDCKKLWHHIIKKKMAAKRNKSFWVFQLSILMTMMRRPVFQTQTQQQTCFLFFLVQSEYLLMKSNITRTTFIHFSTFSHFLFNFMHLKRWSQYEISPWKKTSLHKTYFLQRNWKKTGRSCFFLSCVVKLLYCHFAEFLRVLYVVYICVK